MTCRVVEDSVHALKDVAGSTATGHHGSTIPKGCGLVGNAHRIVEMLVSGVEQDGGREYMMGREALTSP